MEGWNKKRKAESGKRWKGAHGLIESLGSASVCLVIVREREKKMAVAGGLAGWRAGGLAR